MPFLRIEQIQSPKSNRKFKKIMVCLCDICGVEFKRGYAKKEMEKAQERSYCSSSCMHEAFKPGGFLNEKRKRTYIEKYGVEHPSKNDEIVKKIVKKNRETCLERYGTEHFGNSYGARQKMKDTMLERYGVSCSLQINPDECKRKAKETLMANYGVEYPTQSFEILEKRRKTVRERYGVDSVAQSEAFKEKFKKTMLERYGVDNPLKLDEVRDKIKNTCIERYGVEHSSQSFEAKRAAKATCIEKYGVENQMQNEEIKEKMKRTNLSRYGVTNVLLTPESRRKVKQANGVGVSKKETAFYNKLIDVFENVERHVNIVINNNKIREIDYYIRDIDCYVNYNGIYWHGKNKSDDELISSMSSQSSGILRNKRNDLELITWFNESKKRFFVVWEDAEIEGFEMLLMIKD